MPRSTAGPTNRDIPIANSLELQSTVDHVRVGRSLPHLSLLGFANQNAKPYLNLAGHDEVSENTFGWYSRHHAAKFKSMTKTAEIEKWARERGLLKFNETLF